MADTALKEQAVWEEIIRQIETTDTVIGGEDGVPNIAPRQLANRTLFLKVLFEGHINQEKTPDPHPQYVTSDELGSEYAKKVDLYPVGAPILWLSDTLPEHGEYAFMKNQAFDVDAYPELAKVYPDGILDTMQGLGIMGKRDDETVGAVEEGQVKSHGHTGSADSVDLGTKVTNKSGRHRHLTLGASNGGWDYSAGNYQGVSRGSSFSQKYTNYVDDHDHVVKLAKHGHTVTIHPTGAEKNTIDHRKFNFIVRMK